MRLMIVKGSKGRPQLAVEFTVTRKHIAGGINVARPGRYLFRGAWYGRDLSSLRTYGKIEGKRGMPIGKLTGQPSVHLRGKLGGRKTRVGLDRGQRRRPPV